MNTLGFAGMDAKTHSFLHEAFSAAADRLQLDLQLRPDMTGSTWFEKSGISLNSMKLHGIEIMG